LRRRHIQGRRIFVLHGLGGVGKTALAVNLIPKLNAPPERIIMLDAARADIAPDPVLDLWEQMSEPIGAAFPDLLTTVLEEHKVNQDPLVLLHAVIAAVKKPWLIYLDNAESLQVKVESETGDLGAWASPGMAQWWGIASAGAVHGGPLTLAATTRYLWEDLDRLDSRQVGVLRPADIARMMRWLPCLRRMPQARKKRMVQWLNGHARALIYLEGLLKEILAPLTPEDDITDEAWRAAIEEALPGAETKLVDEDLMLSHIWKRLDAPVQKQLRALTALRRPAPLDSVNTLGDQTARLESLGLLTSFPGDFRGMHAAVHRFVEKRAGQAKPEDHSRVGRWHKEAFEAEKLVASAEEAVYHLAAAGEADAAAPLAANLANHYRNNLRYAEAGRVLETVIALSPGADMLGSLLQVRGNLHNDLGRYELAAADFQAMIESARERKSASDHESQGLHGLANALDSLGRYEEAVEAYQKSLEIKKQAYGTEAHPEYAASHHGLANALFSVGRYEEAVEAYQKSLEIQKQAYCTEAHPSYAASLHGLANALSSLDRYEEAVEAYQKSLEIKKQAYGTEAHPEYAA
ncbi:MAG: tetratricopeptide repeat protein, partial [Desulfobacterales bacterium]|nr:tetratricopeptide repeat protein [Desulfobacterales bacterium]